MKITEVEKAETMPNPHGIDARKISETEWAQVLHITLAPGESLKKHVTPVDVVFYVLEGRGIVEIGDERMEVGADALVESPAKIPHRWTNESNRRLRVLVVKTPKPAEPTRLSETVAKSGECEGDGEGENDQTPMPPNPADTTTQTSRTAAERRTRASR